MAVNSYDFFLKIIEGIKEIYPQKDIIIPAEYDIYISPDNLLVDKIDMADIVKQLETEGYKFISKQLSFNIHQKNTLQGYSFVLISLQNPVSGYTLSYRKVVNNELIEENTFDIFLESETFIIGRNEYSEELKIDCKSLKFPVSDKSLSRNHLRLFKNDSGVFLQVLSRNNKVYTKEPFKGKTEFILGEQTDNILNKQFHLITEQAYYLFIIREK